METIGKVGTITYTLSRLKRCRNITVRVLGNGDVRVSAPSREPIASIERVIRANQKKLEKTIAAQKAEHELYAHTWEHGDSFLFHGKSYTLSILPGQCDTLTLEKGVFAITYVGSPPNKETISHALKDLYRKAARKRIGILVQTWAGELKLEVPPFTIRDSKKRWGSCSSRGNLNFSLRSASLSDEELSYLVLHEMAHLVHFDHGPLFHAFLTKHLPNWKEHQQDIFSLQRRADLTP
ncbi:MAG TPA: SprT family zinc-dependent metalloprotease [Sphaerochaeta sp.]|nr:SprT family zinc-dependent metalloprotease [Sphaerochaeta sp.]